jgi:hypothetical protein
MKQKHPFPKIIKVLYKIQHSAYRWNVVFTCAPSAKRSTQLNYSVNLPPWMTNCLLQPLVGSCLHLEAWHIQNSAIATRTARSKALPYLNENPHHKKKERGLTVAKPIRFPTCSFHQDFKRLNSSSNSISSRRGHVHNSLQRTPAKNPEFTTLLSALRPPSSKNSPTSYANGTRGRNNNSTR